MVHVIFGKKGMGKTKILVDAANNLAAEASGDIVFIDDNSELMYDLKHKIRFINVSDFPVKGESRFLGFICGVIAENYDIEGIFIDGLTYITDKESEDLEDFFVNTEKLSSQYNTKFFMSINGDENKIPEYLKKYLMK